MLDLNSPRWAELQHAYGDASDVPPLIQRLRTEPDEWEKILEELFPAILHQGDVYTATYAAMPHLLELASDLGPSELSDVLLESLACVSGHTASPEVPEFVEEAWEDAQSDARELILERLISGLVSETYAGLLIAGLLGLDGNWEWSERVRNWFWGRAIGTCCPHCDHSQSVDWQEGSTRGSSKDHKTYDFHVIPSSEPGITPDDDLEFEDDEISRQLIGLAASTGYGSVEDQMRCLFGHFACASCGKTVYLSPNPDEGG